MLNVIAVMGRMVADPELKKTPNGISTCTFTVACDRSYVKSGAERETDFFDVVVWRGTAEFVCKWFHKGQLVAIDGSLHTRSYEDREGKKRKVYEIAANNVHFAEGRGSGQGQGQPYAGSAAPAPAAAYAPPREAAPEAPAYAAGAPDDFTVIDDSEDMPF